jgi:hypothetical protein
MKMDRIALWHIARIDSTNDPGRNSGSNTIGGNGLCYKTHRADYRVVTDGHSLENHHATSQPHIIADVDGFRWPETLITDGRINFVKIAIINCDHIANPAVVLDRDTFVRYESYIVVETVSIANMYLGFRVAGLENDFAGAEPCTDGNSKNVTLSYPYCTPPSSSDGNLKAVVGSEVQNGMSNSFAKPEQTLMQIRSQRA